MNDWRITSSTPMRVCGYCGGMPGGGRKLEDFGFSPRANLIVRGASAIGHSETGWPHFHFTICDCPRGGILFGGGARGIGLWERGWPHLPLTIGGCPRIGLAEPCRIRAVVVPPASWR